MGTPSNFAITQASLPRERFHWARTNLAVTAALTPRLPIILFAGHRNRLASDVTGDACRIIAGLRRGWVELALPSGMDLMLSLPWLFLPLTLRSVLPLNTRPIVSMTVTAVL